MFIFRTHFDLNCLKMFLELPKVEALILFYLIKKKKMQFFLVKQQTKITSKLWLFLTCYFVKIALQNSRGS